MKASVQGRDARVGFLFKDVLEKRPMFRSATAILLALTLLTSGCATMKNRIPGLQPKAFQIKRADREPDSEPPISFGQPERMAIIWKDSVLQGVGAAPTAGFGGRIYFYDADNRPVRADGELIVYGYDDDNQQRTSSAADRKYVFSRDKFQTHHDRTSLGDSYSIWVPWEKVGGFRKRIMLIPVFKRADGKVIQGEQTVTVLPGKQPERDMLAKTEIPTNLPNGNRNIRQANGSSDQAGDIRLAGGSDVANAGSTERRIASETIDIPPYVGRRIGNNAPATAIDNASINQVIQRREVIQANEGQPVRDLRRNGRSSRQDRAASETPASTRPLGPGKGSDVEPATAIPGHVRHPSQRPVFGQPGAFGR